MARTQPKQPSSGVPTKDMPPPSARGKLTSDQAVDLFAGVLMQLADPDDVLRKAGLNRTNLRALEGDDEISTALETRSSAILATDWRLEPSEGVEAQFIEAEVKRHLEAMVNGAFAAVPYGYSVMEAIYEVRDDNRIGIASIDEKPFEWFRPWRRGELYYIGQLVTTEGQRLDTDYKFFLTVRRGTYRNPRGEALLSRAYWAWFFRGNGWKFWARFLERHGGPLLLGKGNDPKKLAEALASAVQSAAVAVGTQDEVTSVAPGSAGESFDKFCSAVDKRIQKLILGQTLTTDVDGKGSYAAAKVHNLVRADRLAADLRLVGATIQRVINALVALNFPGRPAPEFVFDTGQDLAVDRAERDSKLVNAGIVKLTPKYLLDAYSFREEDIEPPDPKQPEPPVGKQPAPAVKASAHLAHGPQFTADQQALDDLTDDAIAQAPQPIDPARIRAAIKAATSYDDLLERLADLFEDHPPKEYRALMERALFAADVLGYGHAEQRSDLAAQGGT